MKEEEKRKIFDLWSQGYGATRIARELRINVNTVKSYCRRHGLIGDRAEKPLLLNDQKVDELQCKCCGAPVIQKDGVKRKIFCSDKCRLTWWNDHQDLTQRKAEYSFICQNCGKMFKVYGNKRRKFCSHVCYIESRYGKKSSQMEN